MISYINTALIVILIILILIIFLYLKKKMTEMFITNQTMRDLKQI